MTNAGPEARARYSALPVAGSGTRTLNVALDDGVEGASIASALDWGERESRRHERARQIQPTRSQKKSQFPQPGKI